MGHKSSFPRADAERLPQAKPADIPKEAGFAASVGVSAGGYAAAAASANSRGHGVLAEKANTAFDLALLRKAVHVGSDNLKNGPDRIVDGVFIQSKYCSSGSACIKECFDGKVFKYPNVDGTPMQIEVPGDLHAAAVRAMKSRIQRGQVPGVTDPAEAARIVRKGHLTYEQARNLARVGTIESLTYDVGTGAVASGFAFGLSAAVSFAQGVWNGDHVRTAAANAGWTGLQVGGTTFVATVLTKQLARTGINDLMIPASQAIAKQMGSRLASQVAKGISSRTLPGAAATSHVARLLRGNVATAAVTTVVLSSVDIYRLCEGSISGSQAFKNVTNIAAGVAGGTGGWIAGATAGAAAGTVALPVVGTIGFAIIGGFVGAFGLGALASWGTGAALDAVIDDDAKEMAAILEKSMGARAWSYMLTEAEMKEFVGAMTGSDLPTFLRAIYRSDDRKSFCDGHCDKALVPLVQRRARVRLPAPDAVSEALLAALSPAQSQRPVPTRPQASNRQWQRVRAI
jgi:hypothetical protein